MPIKLDGVMETLLITLYVRAKDAMSTNPVIHDKKAIEIIQKIDYDFKKFESGEMSYYGVLARAKTMDEEVKKFIAENPDCVIVSVGCGLDTRFSRVDNGKIKWYNLDFPQVIEQRELFFEKTHRVINIGKSALDPTWTQDVKTEGKKLLIISEGMLMYLKENEISQLLQILTHGFDSFEAQFNWGVKDGSEVVALCPTLQQKGLINFTDELKHLLPGVKKLLVPMMYVFNNRLGIYTYQKME